MRYNTPNNMDQEMSTAIGVCAQQLQLALVGARPVDLDTIRAIQHMVQLTRFCDLRLQANALPPVTPAATRPATKIINPSVGRKS